jgi:hypothetical protein
MTVKNNVLIGKEGRLFLFQGGHHQFDYLTGRKVITKKSAENFSTNIRERQQFCKKNNIIYKHIVFPSKPLVQTSFLPKEYQKKITSLFNKYYKDVMDDESKKALLYPLESLKSLDKAYSSFRKYDTHMSDRACFLIADKLLNLVDISLYDYPYKVSKRLESGDLGCMLNSSNKNEEDLIFTEYNDSYRVGNRQFLAGNTNEVYISHKQRAKTSRRLLIFGDSFFKDVIKYLEPFFIDIVYIRSSTIQYDIIELYQPSVIFTGNAERYFSSIPLDGNSSSFLWELYGKNNYSPSLEYIKAFSANCSFCHHKNKYVEWMESIENNSSSLKLLSYEINKYIDVISSTSFFKFKSTGNDPYIIYKNINFKNEKKYLLKISLISSVDTVFQVFYTDSRVNSYGVSEENSIRYAVKKGSNNFYILLDFSFLGSVLRIDPMNNVGEMDIISIIVEKI